MSKESLQFHLKNLFRIAGADEKISQHELELLFQLGRKLGFSDKEMVSITGGPEAEHPILEKPQIQHLLDLATMMAADGLVDKREMHLCLKIALNYGVPEAKAEPLIKLLIQGVFNNDPSDKVIAGAEELLKA